MAGDTSVDAAERPAVLEEVYVTQELASRPPKRRNYRREKNALQELALQLSEDPRKVLPRFVELAMELTGGSAAGLSLFEPVDSEPGIFRWRHLHGALAQFEDATTPHDHSPCGVTLDRNGPVFARNPERMYDWIAAEDLVLPEVLLVPLHIGSDEPLGTLWITADEHAHFRKEDAEVASELARFVAIALRMTHSEEQLRKSLEEQELLAREMGHRVKNVFAVTESIVRLTAGRAGSAEELAQSLSRRLNALSAAHALARGKAMGEGSEVDLAELVEAIVSPFGSSRFTISGPEVDCGPHAASALALLFHELATNAAKYGALSKRAGNVEIRWEAEEDRVNLSWRERGGIEISGPPSSSGFGSKLTERTVKQQFGGTLEREWLKSGLVCRMSMLRSKLSS